MSQFRDYLEKTYAADPGGVSRFASSAFMFIRIRRRYWRGNIRAKDAVVMESGVPVDEEAVTKPSWKICPKETLKEFTSFSLAVEQLADSYAVAPKEEEDEQSPATVMIGGGRYMVDASVWPRLEELLRKSQEKWSEAADKWCTTEGYERIHTLLREQRGEERYKSVKALIPDRDVLRTKYGLDFRVAPVQIVDKGSGGAVVTDRKNELVDLLDMAVRVPREDVAEAWESLASRLITNGDPPEAVQPSRKFCDGITKTCHRAIRSDTITNTRMKTEALRRSERYLEPELLFLRNKILEEFPKEPKVAESVAKTLRSNDEEAVRIGILLRTAAKAARSETGMCLGLGNALAADPS